MTGSVVVRCVGFDKYTVEFSALPDRKFGPWPFAATVRDLRVSALLSPMVARDLVLDATATGSAQRVCG